jgi:hypothetical protein
MPLSGRLGRGRNAAGDRRGNGRSLLGDMAAAGQHDHVAKRRPSSTLDSSLENRRQKEFNNRRARTGRGEGGFGELSELP